MPPVIALLFIGFIFIGAVAQLNIVLILSDAVYGLLAIPNMIACYMLLPKVKAELTEYTAKLKSGEIKPHE
jgi:AGCS family alanine or glycine:cation symporter